ncbi:hypothetical protein NW762_000315 [Fusarium torreyae]|uniref:Uncharacterized protein n=1 Tax=Fusarium torreyae TaxID=1237075 RepID=A0A9W8VQ68_9HYPO|nr:hypothetical protein NW762_000315 [Fusarium torreyae]
MPPRTRKRKASATESNGTEDAAPKRATRAPRKTETSATNQRRGKNAARELNDSSKKKRKMLASDAKKQVQKQGSDLVKFIDSEIKARLPRDGGDALVKDLSSELACILPWMSSSPALQKKSVQTYPQLMLKALDQLQGHVDAYDTLVKQDTGIRAPTWMRWGQDAKDLDEMSQYGLEMSSQIINHAIMPDIHGLPDKPAESAAGVENVAWDLIEEALLQISDDTWGKVAQRQVKAFTEVLKLLPVESIPV